MAPSESIISRSETCLQMTRPKGDACSQNGCQEIVGESTALQTVLKLAMKAASSDASVLILGEAGSGKELLARPIHRISLRRNESFVKVNCSTADEGALESDLFGDAD